MQLQWYQRKKPRISGKHVGTADKDPADVLKKAGYKQLPNGGFVRDLDKEHRYHAYIIGERKIELHTDLLKPCINGITYHVASTYMCREERERLRRYAPHVGRKYHDEKLTREQYLQAMASLKTNHLSP